MMSTDRLVNREQDRVLRDPLKRLDLRWEEEPNALKELNDLMVPLERLMMIPMDLDAPRPGGPPEAWRRVRRIPDQHRQWNRR